MPDNPTALEPPALPLPGYRMLALTGKDAPSIVNITSIDSISSMATPRPARPVG